MRLPFLALSLIACAPAPAIVSPPVVAIPTATTVPEERANAPEPTAEPKVAPPPARLPPSASAYERFAEAYPIEQLQLIAVLHGPRGPRAMLVDPTGRGWVISEGDALAKAERVQAGGADQTAIWRVAQIRKVDLVLVREVAGHPEIPALKRIVPIQPGPGP